MKEYTVEGFALCPVTVGIQVQASTPEEALAKAKRICAAQRGVGRNRDFYAHNASENEWEDWQPLLCGVKEAKP